MVRVTICRRVYVNRQGYAYGGRQYFGTGAPLYYYEIADGRSGHVRAFSRKLAINQVQGRSAGRVVNGSACADV